MAKNRYEAGDIIHKLSAADLLLAQGKAVTKVSRELGVSDDRMFMGVKNLNFLHYVIRNHTKDSTYLMLLSLYESKFDASGS